MIGVLVKLNIKEGSEKGLRNINLAQFVGKYVKKLSQGVKH